MKQHTLFGQSINVRGRNLSTITSEILRDVVGNNHDDIRTMITRMHNIADDFNDRIFRLRARNTRRQTANEKQHGDS